MRHERVRQTPRFGIAIGALALLMTASGSAQNEIYDNNQVAPAVPAQYHDVVSPQILGHEVPQDQEDPEVPSANPDENPPCVRLFGQMQCAPEEKEIAAKLIARGPADISIDNPERPTVTGFVHDRWPVVIDFAPQPGTMTVLKVRLYHRRLLFSYLEVASRQVIDFNSTGVRRIAVVPALDLLETRTSAANAGVRVAKYSIRSYRLRNGVPELHNGRLVRAPVEIFGIGAGPQAAGSFTLRNVTFSPAQLRIPHQGQVPALASFGFNLDRDFDLVTATVARCGQVCSEMSSPVATMQRALPGRKNGNWPVDFRARPSNYAIVIRAWLTCGGAPADQIRFCEDKAAWAFGRAKPVSLTN
jgi:hypothetical protein